MEGQLIGELEVVEEAVEVICRGVKGEGEGGFEGEGDEVLGGCGGRCPPSLIPLDLQLDLLHLGDQSNDALAFRESPPAEKIKKKGRMRSQVDGQIEIDLTLDQRQMR